MAIAHDATSGSAALINTATTTNWTHTPSGTPKGVVVVIPQGTAADQVSAVTYGGVALGRVRFAARSAAEACAVYTYFLGAAVPTGAQTVAVTTTGTAPCWPQAATVTADTAETAVDVENGLDAGIIANPSLTLVPTVEATLYYVNASGLNAPVSTPEAGTTQLAARDLGTISGHVGTKESAAGGSTTVGWTSASDDVCHGGLAIKESAPSAGPVHQTHTLIAPAAGRTNLSFTAPASLATDDIVEVGIYKDNLAAITPPTGFTQKDQAATDDPSQLTVLWGRRGGGADIGAGPYNFTWTGAAFAGGSAHRISGAITSGDPYNITRIVAETGAGDVNTPDVAVTTTLDDTLAMWHASGHTGAGSTWTPPTSFTEVLEAQNYSAAWRALTAAGGTGTVVGTYASHTDALVAWVGALKPPQAAAVPPPLAMAPPTGT
jgi:hypothetical protein